MLSFSKVLIFIFIIISLPMILNIVDNIGKILKILTNKNHVLDKMIDLTKKEFNDFALEFFQRSHNYEIEIRDNDIYLCRGESSRLLYCNNENSGNFNIDSARKLIGLCESKGVNDLFIFTTKILKDEVISYFQKISHIYNIKYVHGIDFNLNYKEFVSKYYRVSKDTNVATHI